MHYLSDEFKERIEELVVKEDVTYFDVKDVLEDLLNPNGIYPEVYIPISFLFSEYGTKLMKTVYAKQLDFLTTNEVIEELEVSKQYVNRILNNGKLKGTFRDGNWYIKRIDLEEFKKTRK